MSLFSSSRRTQRPASSRLGCRPRSFRPAVELLEARVVPSWATVGPSSNITRATSNQAESTIAINPTNPLNVWECDTISNVGRYSLNGGATWQNSNMSTIPASVGDVQAAWDQFGNLFFTRINSSGTIEVARSSDGGATFRDPRTIANSSGGDQPSIAVGPSGVAGVAGSVWVSFTNGSGRLVAAGAPVNGFDSVSAFQTPEVAPGPGGDFGGIAIGPGGQVMVTYQSASSGAGPDTIKINLDPDGLGPQTFQSMIVATSTNVGGFASIPAQPNREIDAEANLAWDRSGGPHNGRVYLEYVDRANTSTADTDVFVRYSDNNGTTWSSRARVNDDPVGNGKSQFNPAIAVDQTTGNVAITWYDTRNSGAANNTTQMFGSASFDGGVTWCPNIQISAGTSQGSVPADQGFDYGDYDTMDFNNGVFYRSWADNSNSTLDNPNGTLHGTNIYTAKVAVENMLTVAGTPGDDTITVHNLIGDPTSVEVIVNGVSVYTGPWSALTGITIAPSTGNDTINIENDAAGTPITVNLGDGTDVVNLSPVANTVGNLMAAVTVNGGSGVDTLNVDDQGTATDQSWTVTANSVTRSGAGPVSYAGISNLVVNGGTGATTFNVSSTSGTTALDIVGSGVNNTLVGPNADSTWSITASNAGTLAFATGAATFTGVQNLTGGSAADTFVLSDGAGVDGVIDGGGGADTLDYSAYTASVIVNLQTGQATATGGEANIVNVNGAASSGPGLYNLLIGNGGNILTGGAGRRNILVAGTSASTLIGGAQDDLLLGGTTSYDTEPALVSWQAIAAYWAGSDDYSTRLNNLETGNGVPLLDSTTVTGNGGGNTITGAGALALIYTDGSDTISGFDPLAQTYPITP
jgi:hypothetical protein